MNTLVALALAVAGAVAAPQAPPKHVASLDDITIAAASAFVAAEGCPNQADRLRHAAYSLLATVGINKPMADYDFAGSMLKREPFTAEFCSTDATALADRIEGLAAMRKIELDRMRERGFVPFPPIFD